ncbi:DUF2235 domain-containing protein [Emcibacter sp. SYSU 3D8]|uniref:DUF2235 domain-containing protein n=1 Tax=Emcibacter sp. SYSU 3D8 TaxID=3133969 RepID=UPI0031FE50F5
MGNLIVCCDGTWNTPGDKEGVVPSPTNVVKLYNALAAADAAGVPQQRYYHPGVGTEGSIVDKIAGGGMGRGLGRNIMSAYRWLAGHYRPGDRIWLFGFSRGAYTVRSLGGMISRCGLLDASGGDLADADIWAMVDDLFAAYRDKKTLKPTARRRFHHTAHGGSPQGSMDIHFLGVWDTVGALGVPDDVALFNLLDDPDKHSFHDTALSHKVAHARHALAIDETRQSFMPTLWTGIEDRPTVKQVWFPGVHSDVGGGYGHCGLSDGALGWMIEEARLQGLAFRDGITAQLQPDPRGLLHDSCVGVFAKLKTRPRQVPRFGEAAVKADVLHASALDRHVNPPLSQGDYWPSAHVARAKPAQLSIYARERWNATGLYLEAGTKYTFAAEGEWLDASVPSGPGGTRDGKFAIGEVVHLAGSIFGAAEDLFKRLTHNQQADLFGTRRDESCPWFSLIGMVANGWRPDDKGNTLPHQTFLIGKGTTFSPKASGYLYCFANDAWHFYDNNRGSVRLTVSLA